MAALQTVAFGAASDGSQGDSVRTGFTKANSNTAILQAQAALVSNAATITTAQALTNTHVGKRVNISLATAGTINLPSAATCAADNVILLRNLGTTVVTLAITTGSGDTVALSKLNPGESALIDTDGVHAWSVLMRGRASTDNETVNGNCTVNGSETVSGNLTVSGPVVTFSGARPTWVGVTPWDSGNFTPASYARLDGSTSLTGMQTQAGFSSTVGAYRVTANLATAFANFNSAAASALQVDCPTDSACYYGLRWTNWGSRHLAGIAAYSGGTSSSVTQIVFSFQNASQAHIFKDGGAAIFAGALTQNSDYRIKGDVSEIDPDAALAALLRARPVEYARTDIPDDSRHAGFIAHELQEVLPLLVEGEKDATRDEMQDMSTGPQLPPKQVPELQSVNYIGLGPYLVAAVKALAERVAALEAKQAA